MSDPFELPEGYTRTLAAAVASVEDCEVSEDAIARAFTERFAEVARYCHSTGSWYFWTGRRWERQLTQLAFHYTREIGCALSDGGHRFSKAAVAGGAERFARADPAHAVTADVWDVDPLLLGTPDWTIDLRTALRYPPYAGDHITRNTTVSPVDERPDRWLQFLEELTGGDEELIDYLWRVCGYMLTGDVREHALFFAYGPGGNGKSVFINTLRAILGDYSVVSAMETFTASGTDRHSTDLAMLKGARLVTVSETEEGRAWAESRIKQLTGGDPITARFMRQDNFTFLPQFKLFIVGNHKPALRNVDDAARRRFHMIPFERKPPAPDKDLEAKLRAEHPAILWWMILGATEWLRRGLSQPTAVREATAQYFSEQDLFGQWLDERCYREPNDRSLSATSAALYASWQEYATRAGERPGSVKQFASYMQRYGLHPERLYLNGLTQRAYSGIELRLWPAHMNLSSDGSDASDAFSHSSHTRA